MTAVLAPASCGSPGVARAKRSALAPLGDLPDTGARSAIIREKRRGEKKTEGKAGGGGGRCPGGAAAAAPAAATATTTTGDDVFSISGFRFGITFQIYISCGVD